MIDSTERVPKASASSRHSCSISLSSRRATSTELRVRISRLSAAFESPFDTRIRGLSGRKNMPMPCTSAGTAPSPSIQRHVPGTWMKIASITYAPNCPAVISSTSKLTSEPRIDSGATSAMYTGTVIEATPIATPITSRPKINVYTSSAMPINTAPMQNNDDDHTTVHLRPMIPFSTPALATHRASERNATQATRKSQSVRTSRSQVSRLQRHC